MRTAAIDNVLRWNLEAACTQFWYSAWDSTGYLASQVPENSMWMFESGRRVIYFRHRLAWLLLNWARPKTSEPEAGVAATASTSQQQLLLQLTVAFIVLLAVKTYRACVPNDSPGWISNVRGLFVCVSD